MNALYVACLAGNVTEQLWNFAWPAAISTLHPSLLPVAVLGFFSKLVVFAVGPLVGDLVSSIPRIPAYRSLTVIQTTAHLVSAAMVTYAFTVPRTSSASALLLQPWFAALVATTAVDRLCCVSLGVIAERDFIVQGKAGRSGAFKHSRDDSGGEEEAAQRGAFECPCFGQASKISFFLGFQGLAVPVTGVFARLTGLHLSRVWFHGPGELGDTVSSPRCPCLQRLTVEYARGLKDLAIHSESMLWMELSHLHALSQLSIVARVLEELTVVSCFRNSPPIANISTPLLKKLDWIDQYDSSSVLIGKMPHLQWLSADFYLVYGIGNESFIHNQSFLSLLQCFEGIKNLFLTLVYLQVIENYDYMMEDMAVLPDITFLRLRVVANGHAFETSAFHVLRLCTGIRRLSLQLVATGSEAQTVCTSDCICLQLVEWETEELLLNHLEEVVIGGWRGTKHEVAFVKRLFNWGTKIKEMTVNLCSSISEVKAKEICQIFQSFSRPGICMKFYLYEKSSKVLYAPKD